MEYDAARTEVLNGLVPTVLRFTNTQIDNDFESVCIAIDEAVKASIENK